jgi:hypothetical protein
MCATCANGRQTLTETQHPRHSLTYLDKTLLLRQINALRGGHFSIWSLCAESLYVDHI